MRLFIGLLLFFSTSTAAQNLLVNSGFEEENICSEYKVNCAPEAWINTMPSFIYYFKNKPLAHEGDHFVTLIAGHSKKSYFRTFVRSRLLCQLQKGKQYRFQCFIKSVHPVLDSMGLYFSSTDFLFEKQPYHKIRPSLYFKDATLKTVKGDTNWQKLTIDYVADGSEVFIAIGNFSKADITGPTQIELENNFFVLLDDVSLVPTDRNEILCKGWPKVQEEIYAQDERHEYQSLLMLRYRQQPPPVITPLVPTIVLKVDTLLVPDVLFSTGSFTINKQTVYLLDSFINRIQANKIDSIIVNGHTDSRGTDDTNKELSWRRANTVAAYLQQALQTPIISRGFGSVRPIADNRSALGRQKNRRVEILLYKQD